MRSQPKSLIHKPEPLQLGEANALAFAAFDLSISNRLEELERGHSLLTCPKNAPQPLTELDSAKL